MIVWSTSISNYFLSIENFQIYKSFMDPESNAWFTQNPENDTMVCDTEIFCKSISGHGFKSLNDCLSYTIENNWSHVRTVTCRVLTWTVFQCFSFSGSGGVGGGWLGGWFCGWSCDSDSTSNGDKKEREFSLKCMQCSWPGADCSQQNKFLK